MAIITRWLMPPESWCGKTDRRSSGAGMPTSSRSSMARSRRARRPRPRCWRSDSPIWKPTVKHGLRLDIGSWKIMAMSLPMILRRLRALMLKRSLPAKEMRSASTFAVQGRRPIRASMATDLPDPDSPTIDRISPWSQESDTLLTARKRPPAVLKLTDRFSISSSAITTS